MGELSPVTAKRRCHLHRSRIFVCNCLCCHLWLCLSMRELLWDESFRLDVDYYFDIADKGRIEIENKCSALNWGENPRMFTYLNTCFQVLSHCHPSIIKVSKKKKTFHSWQPHPTHTHTHKLSALRSVYATNHRKCKPTALPFCPAAPVSTDLIFTL